MKSPVRMLGIKLSLSRSTGSAPNHLSSPFKGFQVRYVLHTCKIYMAKKTVSQATASHLQDFCLGNYYLGERQEGKGGLVNALRDLEVSAGGQREEYSPDVNSRRSTYISSQQETLSQGASAASGF